MLLSCSSDPSQHVSINDRIGYSPEQDAVSQNQSQSSKTLNAKSDSISIIDVFARNPFPVEDTFYQNLDSIIPEIAIVEREVIPSRQGDPISDTLISYVWNNSKIQFISTPYVKMMFDYAELMDNQIHLRKGIYIGITYEEFAKNFDQLRNSDKNYEWVEFAYGDGTDYVRCVFENGKLIRVCCLPYTG